jgi:hypothetical protein
MTYVHRSRRPCHLIRGSAAFHFLGLWVWTPPGLWVCVCCEYCVLSVRGLCDELTTHCCVVVYDLVTSSMRKPWSTLGHIATLGGVMPRKPDFCTSRRGCRTYISIFIWTIVLVASLLRVKLVWVDLDVILYLTQTKLLLLLLFIV